MKWIVGVDLRPSCEGALAWITWVMKRVGVNATALAVHAVESGSKPLLSPPGPDVIEEHVGDFLGGRGYTLNVRVVGGRQPPEALANALVVHHGDAIAIGRRSTVAGDELVRLGRVARRVLRRLPAPVAVCPADLDADAIPDGPVLIAVQPEPRCVPALRFGRDFATSIGRGIAVACVMPPAFPPGITYLPAPQYHGDDREAAEAQLQAWLEEQECPDVDLLLGEPPTVPALLDAAADVQACAIVCGSRILSTTERLTQSSVGSTLAGVAPVPGPHRPRLRASSRSWAARVVSG